mmetsp:Transcript_111667/g.303111  ORF Transcript_111667/g.303111 Transcript_111667/m.303111 type:complete len:238 (+) Transcript_111667:2-715(+)
MSDDECKAACEGFSWCEALSRNHHQVCGGKCCVLYVGYDGPDPGVISDWSQQFLGNPTNIGDTTAGFSLPVGCTRITRPASASAVGDPHLQNIYGQRFDLMKTGRHVLINVPKGNVENTLLRVDADAERLGGQCADIYFQELNVTGAWAEAKRPGGFRFHAQGGGGERPQWLSLGNVQLKVAHGRTPEGTGFLNFYVKNLVRAGFPVGGLLGEDEHGAEQIPPEDCHRRIDLRHLAP